MRKIALAMIVKGADSEAVFLDQCLKNVSPHVDGIFLTSTYKKGQAPNEAINLVGAKYGANVSYFEWVNDFSKARNFNFSKVTKDYDFILWCDADDTFAGLEKLRGYIDMAPEVDAWTMQYYYDRDANNNPTVVHTKTQVLRNDGSISWVGCIHEDFKESRSITVKYIPDIKRIHMTTDEHVAEARERNLEISKKDVKKRPNDPQAYFNLANSAFGLNRHKEARIAYKKFIETSGSDAEKYLGYQRLALTERSLGNKDKAIEYMQLAIGMFPEFPDAYNQIGYMLYDYGMFDEAERYLLRGLVLKPQYHKMIVYNPRDYDYNPMMALARVYMQKSRPDLALPMLKGCLKIYPNDSKIAGMVSELESATKRLERVVETVKHVEELGDNKEKVLYTINKLPTDLQSHPAICRIRNQYDIKSESSGKDIAYYCGETAFEWNPELFKTKGFGGSEEAVINLSKEWAKMGYNVTVYNSCGVQPMSVDGVTYKPWWMFNHKDKWDYFISWRSVKLADYDLNVGKHLIDVHDAISEGEFTEKRLKRIDKIMVKTKAHRALFPNIPDEKFAIIPNGMDFGLFDQDVKKDRYMLVNTSSPDRSMDVLPKLFKEVKKRVPQARLKWAYGWDNFDKWYATDKRMMDWKEKIVAEMKDAGIEDMGRLPQKECAKLYLEGSILAYPSDFYEIDCITVKKAAACGCVPVTTDFAAMNESNPHGIRVHSKTTIKDWSQPYQIGFGTKDDKAQRDWVNEVVTLLTCERLHLGEMQTWTRQFEWDKIAARWTNIF